jgi:hypothetical protein
MIGLMTTHIDHKATLSDDHKLVCKICGKELYWVYPKGHISTVRPMTEVWPDPFLRHKKGSK